MKFYGVGVKLGAYTSEPKDILQECIENNVWYMGFNKDVKPSYEEIISNVQVGDLIFAKSLHQATKDEMRIKAIGIVVDNPLTENYNNHTSLSVLWIRKFSPPVNLSYLKMNFLKNVNRRNTIFQEIDSIIIDEILKLIKIK